MNTENNKFNTDKIYYKYQIWEYTSNNQKSKCRPKKTLGEFLTNVKLSFDTLREEDKSSEKFESEGLDKSILLAFLESSDS